MISGILPGSFRAAGIRFKNPWEFGVVLEGGPGESLGEMKIQ